MNSLSAFLRRFVRHPASIAGLALSGAIALFAFLGGSLWKHSYKTTEFPRQLPPSGDHPFGTDLLGADMMAQVIRGTRHVMVPILVTIAVVVVAGALALWLTGSLRRSGRYGLAGFVNLVLIVSAGFMLGRAWVFPVGRSWILLDWMFALPLLVLVVGLGIAMAARAAARNVAPGTIELVVLNVCLAMATAIPRELATLRSARGPQPPDTSIVLIIAQNWSERDAHPWLVIWPFVPYPLLVLAALLIGIGGLAATGITAARPETEPETAPVTEPVA